MDGRRRGGGSGGGNWRPKPPIFYSQLPFLYSEYCQSPSNSSISSRAGSMGCLASAAQLECSEVGSADCSALFPITEDSILHNLSARYKRDQIYTNIGSSLISVNPYRRLALYTPDIIEAYHTTSALPPHIYGVADAAHRGVWEKNCDQVVVVTGESGSGKTEAAKLVLQFISAVTSDAGGGNMARDRLLQANPILEAFGNARTRRNDNASRFGKYMEIELDYKGDPVGGAVSNSRSWYIEVEEKLHKNRVTSQNAGERNFHIFYQLLAGADIHTLKVLRLQRNPDSFNLLKNQKFSQIDLIDDRTEFAITKRAFDALGISIEEQLSIFKIVAAILKLGNLIFIPFTNIDGTEGCAVENEYELHEICSLLQCDISSLSSALQTKTYDTRGEEVVTELSAGEATREREGLCRALYSRLFTWVVSRINEAIKVKFMGRRRIIGILDVFGFEYLDNNGFEQLIINFCNEKLQQALTHICMKETQEEYSREGLEWTPVSYSINSSIVDLLEQNKNGILSVIEDFCLRYGLLSCENPTDEDLLQHLATSCASHPNFEVKTNRHQHTDNNLPSDAFRIRHYAGAVTYSIKGITAKNCDHLSRDLSQAMFRCDHPVLKAIFPEGNPKRATTKRPASAISQVQVSVSSLLRTLRAKTLHLVSCIKPNELKQPRILEPALLSHQIKYLGLVELAKVNSDGWAYKAIHDEFLTRYRMLSVHTWPYWRGESVEGCALLLADLPLTPAQYTFGRNKVFLKNLKTVIELEEFRRERLEDLVILLQKVWRGWRQKKHYERLKVSQIIIATAWKSWRINYRTEQYNKILLEIILPQSTLTSHDYGQVLKLVGTIYFLKEFMCFTGCAARQSYKYMKHRQRMEWAAITLQVAYVNYQRWKLLMSLILCPPDESPIGVEWPLCSITTAELSMSLRRLHHIWRCYRYRQRFDQTSRNRMREKVTASIIFKDRKALYTKSISHPFLGDYVRLRQNAQWKKMSVQTNDQYVVFADIVNKITRSSGKFVPILLVLSTSSLLVLDHRTLQIKYRIPAGDIQQISLSPFMDDIAVLHIKPPTPTTDISGSQNLNPGCLFGSDEVKRKGDLVLQTGHVIEIVTKLFLVVQNAIGKPPDVNICSEFESNYGQGTVVFVFKTSSDASSNQIRILKRQNRIEVTL